MSREEDRREAAERVLDAWLVKRESGQATSSEVFLQEHEALQDLLAPLVVEALNAEELQQGLEGALQNPRVRDGSWATSAWAKS